MTPRDFCYWLQGFFEFPKFRIRLSNQEVKMIKEHLALVFVKVTGKKRKKSYKDIRYCEKKSNPLKCSSGTKAACSDHEPIC